MVSQLSISFMIISVLISILFPVLFYVFCRKKYRISLKPIIFGILVFILFSQLIGKVFNIYILNVNETTSQLFNNEYLYALYGGISASFFEESGRIIIFTYMLKRYREWKDALSYGIGHGGIEAIIIGGFAGLQNILVSQTINSGSLDSMIKSGADGAQNLLVIKNQLVNSASYLYLLIGIERITVFIIQLALTVLVLYAIANSKYLYLFYAMVFHITINFFTTLSGSLGWHIAIPQLILVIGAIVSFIIIRNFKSGFNSSHLSHTNLQT